VAAEAAASVAEVAVAGSPDPITQTASTSLTTRVGAGAGNVARGFAMGAVDVVPGVSGGTIALVLGIYRRLIDSMQRGAVAISRFLRLDFAGGMGYLRQVEWAFLLPLVFGILASILIMAGPIEHALERFPVPMAGLFLGLVAGSVVVAVGLLPKVTGKAIAVMVGVGLGVFLLMGLSAGTESEGLSNPPLWAYPAAAMIAVCAMILPGVSGSFLLVMLGMYAPVLAAAADRDWPILFLFVLGAAVGLAVFARFLHWALQHHYTVVLSAMIGLMLGSVRVLWPWPAGLESTALGLPDGQILATVGLAVLGFSVVVGFDLVAHSLENRTRQEEVADLKA
jgi:putative membrane protein